MRKLILAVAVLLIATAIIGPGITGRLAERVINENNDAVAASLPDWLMLVEQQFDRGWFASRSRYRLVVTNPQRVATLARLLGANSFADEPAIIVESQVGHGPLVMLFTPALARVESIFLTDDESGGLRVLPLSVTSTFGLTGNARFDWLIGDGSIGNPAVGLRWQQIEIEQHVDNGLSQTRLEIRLPQAAVALASQNEPLQLRELQVDLDARRQGGEAFIDGNYEFSRLAAENSPALQVDGRFGIAGLPLRELGALQKVLRELGAPGVSDPAQVIDANLSALINMLGEKLLLEWSQHADSDAGDMNVTLNIELPAAASINATTNAASALQQIAMGSTANADLTMAAAYAEQLASNNPKTAEQLTIMRGMGILVPDESGDSLSMSVSYSEGSLTVNGLPMPVSLPSTP